jgi:hypothetical protein
VAVIVTEVVCIFYLRADAIVAPCLGQLGSFVPPGQANTCAQLKEFKQTSDVGVTFLLCFISFGVIVVLVGCIVYLRVREAALADPNSRAAKWMRTTCGRRLARYASKLEASVKEESEVVARVEARKAAKAAAKAGSAGVGNGVLACRRSLLEWIPGGVVSLEKEVFPKLIGARHLAGFVGGRRFYDIGSAVKLEAFEHYLTHDHHTHSVPN